MEKCWDGGIAKRLVVTSDLKDSWLITGELVDALPDFTWKASKRGEFSVIARMMPSDRPSARSVDFGTKIIHKGRQFRAKEREVFAVG